MQDKEESSIHEPTTKTWHKTQQTLAYAMKENSVPCVFHHKQRNKCWECNIGLCAMPCFKVYHTKLHFWGSTDTEIEKQNTQMSVNITIVINELIFLSSIFLMK